MRPSSKIRAAGWLYLVLAMLFVLGPILVTIAFSFNVDRFSSLPWRGFTLEWYQKMPVSYTHLDVYKRQAFHIL